MSHKKSIYIHDYYDDWKIWSYLKAKLSGTYILSKAEFKIANKGNKIINNIEII